MTISEAFPCRALYCAQGPLRVTYSECNAVTIPKIKFIEVALQMLLAAVLIRAAHSAFEKRKETLNRVCRNITARIFTRAVFDLFVAGEFVPNPL